MAHLLLATVIAASSYTPPGILKSLVDEKLREVERLRGLPEAREDGPWHLRLAYPAETASYELGRALGWKDETPTVLADLKRASPTGELGKGDVLAPNLVIEMALAQCAQLGVTGALINTDLSSYGGSVRDLKAACAFTGKSAPVSPGGGVPGGGGSGAGAAAAAALPLVAKDLIVDPLQIARLACEGARSVLLIAAACLPDLLTLLDTCTLLGVEAIVEVHTPDELNVASGCGAGLILVNERDRATGKLVLGQSVSLAPLLPPDATCLATGGICRIDQVRTLRRAGYDGFVLGRALLGDPREAEALMKAINAEEPRQRITESISVPIRAPSPDPQAERAKSTPPHPAEPPP
jgi:indole-3-glycerol phosphate synthase